MSQRRSSRGTHGHPNARTLEEAQLLVSKKMQQMDAMENEDDDMRGTVQFNATREFKNTRIIEEVGIESEDDAEE